MTIRDSFVEAFGEDNAVRVEEAALLHLNDFKVSMGKVQNLLSGPPVPDVHDNDNWGSDPFRYLFMLCIGRDCFRIGGDHPFTMSDGDVRMWSRAHADLLEFDGDPPDYLALMVGQYYGYIDWEKAAEKGIYPPPGWAEHDQRDRDNIGKSPTQRLKEAADLLTEATKFLNNHTEKGPSNEEQK